MMTSLIRKPLSSFEILCVTETLILLRDLDLGRSVTNDAENVIAYLQSTLPDGISDRQVIYRDSMRRFDQLLVADGTFAGFLSCSDEQQAGFRQLADTCQPVDRFEASRPVVRQPRLPSK